MILYERRASGILYNLLRSLDGDRPFLLPANVCSDVPRTFRQAGRAFRLVDLDSENLGMDQRDCLAVVAEQPAAWAGVVYVRPYGAEVEEVDGFFRALKELQRDLLIVDDRCLCLPDCDGERLASFADVVLFSTGRAKPVALGFGGFAHCRDGVRYQRAGDGESWLDLSVPALGWDAYRTAVQEALPRAEEHRRRLNAIYTAALPKEIQLPARFQGWRFHIFIAQPDRLIERLFAAGLFASRHYASLGGVFAEERFPMAESLQGRIVNLFNDASFDEERALRAVDCVLGHLAECGYPEE